MIKIRIDKSAKLFSLPNRLSGINASERIPSKTIKKPAETISSPRIINTPENSTKIVATATNVPRKSGSINYHPDQREEQF